MYVVQSFHSVKRAVQRHLEKPQITITFMVIMSKYKPLPNLQSLTVSTSTITKTIVASDKSFCPEKVIRSFPNKMKTLYGEKDY